MADATVTFSLLDVLGLPFDARRTKVWAEFNTEDGWVVDEDGKIRMDAGSATVDDTGLVTLAGIPVPSVTTNPTDWQVKIHYDVPVTLPGSRGKTRKRDDFGWMTITADADLTDLIAEQYVPPTWLSTAISTLQGMIDDAGDDFDVKLATAQDLLDAQVALSGIDDTDSAVAGIVGNNALGPLTRAALRSLIAGDVANPTSAVGIALAASIDARVPNVAIPTWQAGQTVAAGVLRRDPSGNLITRISSGTTGSTYNGTEAAAWRKDGDGYSTVAGLPTSGIVLAHRGAESIWPEETDLAFAGAIAGGADALEMDCQLLADGALAVIHDDTVDRTTTSTGSVSTYSSMAWKNLVCDPSSWLGPGWPNVTGLPLLRETLAKYGRQTILMVEPKTGASVDKAITDVLATGTQDTVILEASALADLTKIKAAGLYAYYYWPTTVGSPVSVASVVSAGANFLGGPVSLSDADITTLVATGKPVIIYGANRQYDKARLDALGVAGYMVGDPAYIKGAHTPVLTDRFSELIRQHGLITTTSDSTMTLVSPNKLTLSAGSQQGVVLGHMSPIANRAGTFSLSADVCYETLPAGTNVLELSIATTDINYPVRNYSGYSATLYKDGTLRIFKHVELGSSTLISGSIATPALTAGGFATLKLDVTPTTVKVTRDGNATYSATVTDSTYRGGFIHFSKNAADASASIRNVTVS